MEITTSSIQHPATVTKLKFIHLSWPHLSCKFPGGSDHQGTHPI